MTEETVNTEQTTSPEVEVQARDMGWRPKEEFKGAEGKWVDAKTFVERGEHVLPIVKATNERLRQDLISTNTRLNEVTNALKASQETIEAIERYHQDDVKQKVEQARERLKKELVQAKKDGNIEAEVDLTEELGNLNRAEGEATGAPAKKVEAKTDRETKDYTQEPDFIAWKQDNPWFEQDSVKAAIAYDVSAKLRRDGDKSTGRTYLDKISAGVAKELARLGGGRSTQKVESSKGGSGGGAGGGNGSGKSYADLPAEAKTACDSFARDLVGKDRRYKTTEEWRKSYVTQYFAEV